MQLLIAWNHSPFKNTTAAFASTQKHETQRRKCLQIVHHKQNCEYRRDRTLPRETHQGSNSWIMLSNRMTANSLELKPPSQASARMKKVRRLFQPPGFHMAERMSVFTAMPVSAILQVLYTSYIKQPIKTRHAAALRRRCYASTDCFVWYIDSMSGERWIYSSCDPSAKALHDNMPRKT